MLAAVLIVVKLLGADLPWALVTLPLWGVPVLAAALALMALGCVCIALCARGLSALMRYL